MRTTLRRVGTSRAIVIPEALLEELGFSGEVELSVERGAIVLRKPSATPRAGWAEDSERIAAVGDDEVVWPPFANDDDATLVW